MSEDRSGYYVWFDTEYTSLRLDEARLLQVAVLVTDGALRRVEGAANDLRLDLRLPPEAAVSDWVRNELADLLARSRGPDAVTADEADRRLAGALDALLGPPAEDVRLRPVLAGNTIGADRRMAERWLPRFAARLHYRQLDVSSIKLEWQKAAGGEAFDKGDPEAVRAWFPGARLEPGRPRHDAYYDLQASLAELAFYRARFFRVLPA